ncbi:sigma-54-dependent Fis family transcriptional regulator [Azohydromonas lata]|uniref:Sigma-54-dependent Fis family transcriptional regulator n=1 Tax=Azohydromonas lata TaxID=45677 RepID=A0ABU5IMZ5_9BURK|nr:sigma-54-dependent Fis family transcriptional regulator [Azohydromonas lata]MDZ5460269.1 sigma-54-dependent Fis family transcriptional regulator [Azohydromonas lata]
MSRRSNATFMSTPAERALGGLIRDSHERCLAQGLTRIARADAAAQESLDPAAARERSCRLLALVAPAMEMLSRQTAGTHTLLVLADARGTVLQCEGDVPALARGAEAGLVPGAPWAEPARGTNAIGTALVAERPVLVHADEHFMHACHGLSGAAAPVFDLRQNLLGVLCLYGDRHVRQEHAAGLLDVAARMAENLACAEHGADRVRLHFHARPEFIGTLLEGIVAVGLDGRLLGANRSALEQLGLSGMALRNQTLPALFGVGISALAEQVRAALALPMTLRLRDGRPLHVSVRMDWATLAALTRPEAPAAAAGGETGAAALPWTPAGLCALQTGDVQIEAVVQKVRRVVNRDIPLLILGETGTGKELLARAVHLESRRAAQAFVAVNCASIPEALIEAELFGYEEGAFTGARRKGASGRIAQAHGGTLFLDEIGDMPLPLQARLLRVLQERRVMPLGGGKALEVDIAVIGATHRNLREMIQRGEFREDLYYRLNGLVLRLPPLRERSDLALVAQRILAHECPRGAPRISAEVMSLFERCHWPGNVRQLANVLRAAAVMAAGEPQITREHLADDFLDEFQAQPARPAPLPGASATPFALADASTAASAPEAGGALLRPALSAPAACDHAGGCEPSAPAGAMTMHEQEIRLIEAALAAAGGNISAASKRLGISRNTIYRKLRWNTPASGIH